MVDGGEEGFVPGFRTVNADALRIKEVVHRKGTGCLSDR
jgi:hypothetical protein